MPRGIYQHKPQQGFQKGHKLLRNLDTYKNQGEKIRITKKLHKKHLH